MEKIGAPATPLFAAPAAQPERVGAPLSVDRLHEVWAGMVASAPSMMMRTLLGHARLKSVAAGVARIVVDPAMRSLAEGRRGELEQMLARHGGVQARIEIEAGTVEPAPEAGADAPGEEEGPMLPPGSADEVREHPLVREAARLFGAQITRVEPRARRAPGPDAPAGRDAARED